MKVYRGNLRKEITPSRLYNFLNMANINKYNKEEIYEFIYPKGNRNDLSKSEYNRMYSFALDTELISQRDYNVVYICEEIKTDNDKISISEYKETMNHILFGSKDSLFYKINRGIYRYDNKEIVIENIGKLINVVSSIIEITNEDARAYRFWARYLGYIEQVHSQRQGFLIANPYRYLIWTNKKLLKKIDKKDMLISEYISLLVEEDPIFEEMVDQNNFTESLSLAISMLDTLKYIDIDYLDDAEDIWTLNGLNLIEKKRISNIELRDTDE